MAVKLQLTLLLASVLVLVQANRHDFQAWKANVEDWIVEVKELFPECTCPANILEYYTYPEFISDCQQYPTMCFAVNVMVAPTQSISSSMLNNIDLDKWQSIWEIAQSYILMYLKYMNIQGNRLEAFFKSQESCTAVQFKHRMQNFFECKSKRHNLSSGFASDMYRREFMGFPFSVLASPLCPEKFKEYAAHCKQAMKDIADMIEDNMDIECFHHLLKIWQRGVKMGLDMIEVRSYEFHEMESIVIDTCSRMGSLEGYNMFQNGLQLFEQAITIGASTCMSVQQE